MKQLAFCPEILATQKILWGAACEILTIYIKIFSQPLDKIKLFFKQRKIIKIKFRSIWSILKAFTASRNLDIYENNVLFRKAPLEGSDSNLWKGFTWLLLLFFSYVFKAPDLCFDMVLPRTYKGWGQSAKLGQLVDQFPSDQWKALFLLPLDQWQASIYSMIE